MRDVVKTNVKREQNSKRTRRRKRNVKLYVFVILVLSLGLGVLLSVTLLFNIDKINIIGDEVDYSEENIIKASGVKIGDNLVRLDAQEVRGKILASMIFVEDAKLDKKYPDTLEISLVKCVESACVECKDGYMIISKKGKLLEKTDKAKKDLLVIKGFEPKDFKPGEFIESTDEQKTNIYHEIMEGIEKYKDTPVTMVDMTDKYSIIINYDNRIDFKMGNSNEIAYKMNLANTVLHDLDKDKTGTMIMVGANQISFRNSTDGKNSKRDSSGRIPIENDKLPGATEATESAEEGADDGAEDAGQEYTPDEEWSEDTAEEGEWSEEPQDEWEESSDEGEWTGEEEGGEDTAEE